jgi:hypothetical protein
MTLLIDLCVPRPVGQPGLQGRRGRRGLSATHHYRLIVTRYQFLLSQKHVPSYVRGSATFLSLWHSSIRCTPFPLVLSPLTPPLALISTRSFAQNSTLKVLLAHMRSTVLIAPLPPAPLFCQCTCVLSKHPSRIQHDRLIWAPRPLCRHVLGPGRLYYTPFTFRQLLDSLRQRLRHLAQSSGKAPTKNTKKEAGKW